MVGLVRVVKAPADRKQVLGVLRVAKIAGIGDFNDDGTDDVLWRNSSDGSNAIWRGGDSGQAQAVDGIGDQNWKIVGTGDYNADGKADILWRNSATGDNAIWQSANSATSQGVYAVPDGTWDVPGQTETWLRSDGTYGV